MTPAPEFHITSTDRQLTVRLNVSEKFPHKRFHVLLLHLAIFGALDVAMLFASGKDGSPSIWADLSSGHTDPTGIIFLLLVWLAIPVPAFFIGRKYVMAAYPSDQTLECDRSALTISKVRWLDRSNTQWDTHSYALADISDMHLGVIASSRGSTISGLLFRVQGSRQTALPGLTPRQAGIILNAMEGFGVDRGATRAGPRKRKP